jgi:CRP/FNR family transcriptional regulator, cyclic AMP receptor protein
MMVVNSLSAHSCFKTLDPQSCRDLDRQCTWLKTPAGAWVAGQADNDRDVYFVLTGRLRVALHGAWHDRVFSEIAAGFFFGELAALEGAPDSLGALAIDDSTLAKMPSTLFVATLFNHRPLGEAVVAALVVRNRALTRRVAEAAQICSNPLPSGDRTTWRPVQGGFDTAVDVHHINGNHRRARRWS